MKKKAALYLRSSKDRSDVSIDSQRRELKKLAAEQDILIVSEYSDAVESGKSEHRPGFQQLIYDMKSPSRNWDTLLLTDTSRLSRRRYVAHVFKHEAEKRGIQIMYSKVPEVDPISQVILESVLEAMDEVHSLMSREKGLAGMAENVRQGFRAGGRAPRGYKLKKMETGAIRDGEFVSKTVLVPNDESKLVIRYLKARVAGTPRRQVIRDLGIKWSANGLVDLEWNALTYAGHTVWNVRNERLPGGGYKGGTKRKPRSDWMIQRDTHEALITDTEAEALISNLENSVVGEAIAKAKAGLSDYLLTGFLESPDGRKWRGLKGTHYHLQPANGTKGKTVRIEDLDTAVVGKLIEDMKSVDFVTALTRESRKAAEAAAGDPAKDLRLEIVKFNGDISKMMDLAAELEDPAPALRKVDELERKRKALADEMRRVETEYSQQTALASITEKQVKDILDQWSEDIENIGRQRLKTILGELIERIILDPSTYDARIHYRISTIKDNKCLNMASPRGVEPRSPP